MKSSFQKGFTLLELSIVLAILTVLLVIVLSTFISFRKNQALQNDTDTIVEVLSQARSQTLLSQNSSQYGVHLTSSKATLFVGTVYDSSSSSNKDFNLTPTDTIVTISLTGGGVDVIFDKLSGQTSQSGTIVISSPSTSRIKTVTIYKTGIVETQ